MDGSSPIHVFQFKLPKHSVSHEWCRSRNCSVAPSGLVPRSHHNSLAALVAQFELLHSSGPGDRWSGASTIPRYSGRCPGIETSPEANFVEVAFLFRAGTMTRETSRSSRPFRFARLQGRVFAVVCASPSVRALGPAPPSAGGAAPDCAPRCWKTLLRRT